MEINRVGVIGAGQMGAGIAQVCASIGKFVTLCDIKQEFVDSGIVTIKKNLERSALKKRISQNEMDETLGRISTSLSAADLKNSDIATIAAQRAITASNVNPEELDYIILAQNLEM